MVTFQEWQAQHESTDGSLTPIQTLNMALRDLQQLQITARNVTNPQIKSQILMTANQLIQKISNVMQQMQPPQQDSVV